MTILHLSDTHAMHNYLHFASYEFSKDTPTVIIHSGDAANSRNPAINEHEMREFLEFYSGFISKDIPKIYVAGNHDTSIWQGLITRKDFEDRGIIYLQDEETVIEGVKFYGSPWTPTFGDWVFMKPRHKMGQIWEAIPEDVQILITHGPPKGILDIGADYSSKSLCSVGCKSLRTKIETLLPQGKLIAHLFGHVHNLSNGYTVNSGLLKIPAGLDSYPIQYSNGACVTDGKFNRGLSSFGNLLNI